MCNSPFVPLYLHLLNGPPLLPSALHFLRRACASICSVFVLTPMSASCKFATPPACPPTSTIATHRPIFAFHGRAAPTFAPSANASPPPIDLARSGRASSPATVLERRASNTLRSAGLFSRTGDTKTAPDTERGAAIHEWAGRTRTRRARTGTRARGCERGHG